MNTESNTTAQELWGLSLKKIKSWGLPHIKVNESTGYVTLSGCWGRSGVQVYFDENNQAFGRYRSPKFIQELGDMLVNAPISLQHKNIHVQTTNSPKHGWVSRSWFSQDSGELLGFCEVVLETQDAVDEVITQLNTQGYCFLPLSPAYSAATENRAGLWTDNGGFYSAVPRTFEYKEEHVVPVKEVNHLSIVDLGRGGPLAGLYAELPPTLDGLYPYPSIAPKRARRPTNMSKPEAAPQESKLEQDSMIQDMKTACDEIRSMMKDMFEKDSVAEMKDMVEDMKTSMDSYSEKLKETADSLGTSISSLVGAIKESYGGSEMPAAHTANVDQKSQAEGEKTGFVFDGAASEMNALAAALDSIAKIAQTSQDGQKLMQDRLEAMEARQKRSNASRSHDQLGWATLRDEDDVRDSLQKSTDSSGNAVFGI